MLFKYPVRIKYDLNDRLRLYLKITTLFVDHHHLECGNSIPLEDLCGKYHLKGSNSYTAWRQEWRLYRLIRLTMNSSCVSDADILELFAYFDEPGVIQGLTLRFGRSDTDHARHYMHSGWLVEMAGLWGYHGATLCRERDALPVEAVNQYWLRSRIRFDGWNAMLSTLRSQTLSLSIARRVRAWNKLRSVIEEVLLAEPLTRVCVAVAAQLEERQVDSDSRSILHNVLTTHCEVRNRCLKIILEGVERGISEADELNRLRHYLEHWTDMLLGYFANSSSGAQYAFSVTRMEEFAEDYSQRMLGTQSKVVWSLLQASCRAWLDAHCDRPPVSPRMNQRICEAAVGMIHPHLFDSLGCMRSRLIQSIEHGIDHADETVARLENGSWESMSHVLSPASNTKPIRFEV